MAVFSLQGTGFSSKKTCRQVAGCRERDRSVRDGAWLWSGDGALCIEKWGSCSSREFQNSWTEDYGMVKKGDKAVCILCSTTIVCRTSSVKRHYETNHNFLLKKTNEEQKEYILQAIKNNNLQTNTLIKFVGSNSNIVAASSAVSNVIAKRGKPFCDGEYIKDLMLETAPFLFEDFSNKDKIMQRIKDLPITRNTVKDRILKISENITNQQFADFKYCNVFLICLYESTDITGSAQLSIYFRYFVGSEIKEELVKLVSLQETTKGTDICKAVVNTLSEANADFSRIVSVNTDGAPSMTGKEPGFINLFTKHVGHPLLGFHCIIHQEALCAKNTFKSFDAIIKLVTKIVNFITARGLNKRKFENLLKEVNSVYRGLVMFNNVRWLSRGNVLQRFIECFDEIKMFLDEQNQIHEELSDLERIARLMFFADFTQHLNELNNNKIITCMFDTIQAFQYISELEIFNKPDMTHLIQEFSNIIGKAMNEFSTRFTQFKEFEETMKIIVYPDTLPLEKLNLKVLELLNLDDFEMQLVDFQSSTIWNEKFVILRNELEEIQRDRAIGKSVVNIGDKILKVWNEIPKDYSTLKIVALAVKLSVVTSGLYIFMTWFLNLTTTILMVRVMNNMDMYITVK
ncbi:SCAN domain-containing protein 3-like [Metopolophium dirhodum]|uniref:SCAN domain-containing protein 3-like n=1 Tax=Metopolophium dirhodum TaxID=44670 RepID=UPI002990506C|nr:SCAN domain-containing protein 3-like [Metopolophium dirhodum]